MKPEKWHLREKLIAALSIIAAATLLSFAYSEHQAARNQERRAFTAALDTALATMAEQLVHLAGIQSALGAYIAADDRNELERSLPVLDGAIADLGALATSPSIAEQAREVMGDGYLNPLGSLENVVASLRVLTTDADLWGDRATFQVSSATAATMQALPLLRRIKEIEAEDLARAAAWTKTWERISVGVVLAILLLIWGAIFRPLERGIRQDRDRLRDARIEAEKGSAAKSMFIATMSHEIRTPLVGVLGAAELLRDTRLDAGQAELTDTVIGSGRELLGILDDVLDFSKIEAGHMDIARAPVSVPDLIGELGRLFRPRAQAGGVELGTDLSGAVRPAHLGDAMRLRQVLANLVGNAVKFTETGHVAIRVAAGPARHGRQTLAFSVADTGIGMSPAHLAHVFEAFTQADGTTARAFGGTGLGLTIAARLVAAMGGKLEVESAPGAGSTFSFDLVLDLAPAEAARPASVAVAVAEPGNAQGAGLHVLVVDDNPTNRLVAEKILSRMCRRVDVACDGVEAVAAFEDLRPDIVLMDISMPQMDGYAATRAIREMEARMGWPRAPIAALTAHTGDDLAAACRAAGMDGVLKKPFARAEIAAALDRLTACDRAA